MLSNQFFGICEAMGRLRILTDTNVIFDEICDTELYQLTFPDASRDGNLPDP